jgi:serine/threonine protein kinase/tetratricopeptide (TPR) repeat protein
LSSKGSPQANDPQALVGTTLADRYRLDAVLGVGGSGSVYRAHDLANDLECALKVLHPWGTRGDDVARSKREFRAAARMSHPNCVRVFGLESAGDRWFFTMELVEGGALQVDERLPWQKVVPIALQVLAGLDHIHSKRVVHRDVKPANILLSRGEPTATPLVKLADFGISRSMELEQVRLGSVTGSPPYLAPEQLEGGAIDARTDLYSVGVVLYQVLTMRAPFARPITPRGGLTLGHLRELAALRADANLVPLAEVLPDVPSWLSSLVMRLLRATPDDRPQTVAIVFDELSAGWATSSGHSTPLDLPPLARAPHLAAPRLVGRSTELSRLQSFVKTALASPGSPFLCFVRGPAGSGKSRIVNQIAVVTPPAGVHVLTERWRGDGGGWPLSRILDWVVDPAERESWFVPGTHAEGQDLQARAYRLAAEALLRAATVEPLLVVLEDAHWADAAALDFLSGLVRFISDLRSVYEGAAIAIVVTHRPSDENQWLDALLLRVEELGVAFQVDIGPLPLDDATELLASMLMTRAQDSVRLFAQRLLATREPYPLYLTQTLHLLLSRGVLRREGADWNLDDIAGGDVQLPHTIVEAIGDRAAWLSVDAKRLLATAAIIGRELTFELLQAATHMDHGLLFDRLDETIGAGFIEEHARRGDVYQFTHDRFREAIRSRLSPAEAMELHEHVADAISRLYADAPDWAASLAYHYASLGRPAHAHGHALRAAEHAMDRSMFVEAAEHFDNGFLLAHLGQLTLPSEMSERRADACLYAGRYEDALGGYRFRLQSVHDPLERAEILRKSADAQFRKGDTARAGEELEGLLRTLGVKRPTSWPALIGKIAWRVATLAPWREPRAAAKAGEEAKKRLVLVARACLRLAEIYYFSDNLRGTGAMQAAISASRALGPSPELAQADVYVAMSSGALGHHRMAASLRERALTHAALAKPVDFAWIQAAAGMTFASAGDSEEALRRYLQAESILEAACDPLKQRQVWGLAAEEMICRGDFRGASQRIARIHRLTRDIGDERGKGWALYLDALIVDRRGDHARAAEMLEAAAGHSERGGDTNFQHQASARRAIVLLEDGRIDEALEAASNAAQGYGRRNLWAPHAAVHAALWATAGAYIARHGRLGPPHRARLMAVWRRSGLVAYRAQLSAPLLHASRALYEIARGRRERGMARIARAIDEAGRLGLEGELLDIYAIAAMAAPDAAADGFREQRAALAARLFAQ